MIFNPPQIPAQFRSMVDVTSSYDPGTWNNPIVEGGASGIRRWYDTSTGFYRTKVGSNPSSEIDGAIIPKG